MAKKNSAKENEKKKSEKLKLLKTIGIIAAIVMVIVLSFVIGNKDDGFDDLVISDDVETIIANAESESASVKESEMKEPTQINLAKYLEYKVGSEPTIILLARPDCHYCQIAEPIIYNIAYKYDLDINYLNTNDFAKDTGAISTFMNSDEAFQEGFGTPYLFIVKDGSIIDAVDGLTDRAHYVEFFKLNGYIE